MTDEIILLIVVLIVVVGLAGSAGPATAKGKPVPHDLTVTHHVDVSSP